MKMLLEEGRSQEDFPVRAQGRVYGRTGKRNENAGTVDRRIHPPVGLIFGSVGDQHRQG